MSMPVCTFPRGFHLIFAKLVLGSLLLAASSGAAMAVKASAPTVTCTGQCEACIEMEQGNRCVKCGIAPNCLGGDPGLSSDLTEMLGAHNGYRARHCAPALTWSAQLAKGAQDWANACTPEPNNKDRFAHSPQAWSSASGYGENLYWGARTTARNAADWWYNEIQSYNFANPVFSNDVGHFTQLVWKNSTQLGCGVALCGGKNFWVCRYSPPGNFNVNTPGVLAANVLQSCAQKKQGGSTKPQSVPVPAGPADAGQNQRGEWSAFASNERGNWGYGAHWATEQVARDLATNGCGGAGVGCNVFWTTTDQCVSFAESRAGGYWFAAGGGGSQEQAKQNAIRFCQSGTAPPNSCKSTVAECR